MLESEVRNLQPGDIVSVPLSKLASILGYPSGRVPRHTRTGQLCGYYAPDKLIRGVVKRFYPPSVAGDGYLVVNLPRFGGVYLKPAQFSYLKQARRLRETRHLMYVFTHIPFNRDSMSIGTDPEIFVVDKIGQVIPAFRFLPRKEQAHTVNSESPRLFWDGFQAEWTFRQAYTCLDGMTLGLRSGLQEVLNCARQQFPDARLSVCNVHEIPETWLAAAPDEYVALGCKPSLNAYGIQGERVGNPRALKYRFAGGHMHFGFPHGASATDMVKALDAILGVSCVSLAAALDNPIRRKYYGLAGEHRLPSYGVEYRVPSNFWLCAPQITHLVWDLARMAISLVYQGFYGVWQAEEAETIEVINNLDVPRARKILDRNKQVLIYLLGQRYYDSGVGNKSFNVLLNGVESAIAEPDNLPKNWFFGATVSDLNAYRWGSFIRQHSSSPKGTP